MTPGSLEGAADPPHASPPSPCSPAALPDPALDVDHPDAPDGIAVIGADPVTGAYVQHYFDSRGVARDYAMGLTAGVGTLERFAEHPDFSQRFVGRFSPDGDSILGRWERSMDLGATWSPDFDLVYGRMR